MSALIINDFQIYCSKMGEAEWRSDWGITLSSFLFKILIKPPVRSFIEPKQQTNGSMFETPNFGNFCSRFFFFTT